jgi:hypothetical protein
VACPLPAISKRVRARRRRGDGRFSLRPRCRCAGRRASHTTPGVGEPVVREPGYDHVPHDRTRSRRGNISASVSAPARRGRCPDRLEDLLRRRRDATRVGPARPMADGRGLPGRRLHTALYPRWRTFFVGGPRLQRPPVSPLRRADRSRRWSRPRTHPRRARRFRRIGGLRWTRSDDRGYPCPVLQCDRRFGGDVTPSEVVLLAERTLALSLRRGRRRSRDDGRSYRRIGGRVRPRLRRADHLT